MRLLAVFALAASLCAWTGDARAQGSAETDRAALVAVYRATGGDDWTDNANWLSDAPLRDWHGVETNEQGLVTGLRLGGWDETAREYIGNGLTGSLPSELGALSHLQWLEIGGNGGLTGPIPAALGNLANLESLFLQENRLTGPIPAALGRLGNLGWLGLDGNELTGSIPADLGNLKNLRGLTLSGNGLCVPDTPAMRAWVAAISDFSGVFCVGSVAFSRVVTRLDVLVDTMAVVADLDGDGRDDILAVEYQEFNAGTPEERLTKTPLRVFINVGDGSFKHAPELVAGTIDVRTPIVVADDFNGDGRDDLAIFDAGVYVNEHRSGYGNPPQLYLSSPDGRLRPSEALADTVRREHELRPEPGYSGPADLHIKTATSGDILMPGTQRDCGVSDAFDPRQNVDAGIAYLRRLTDEFGTVLALAAYNAGPGAVRRYNGIPPYDETRDYVRAVLARGRPAPGGQGAPPDVLLRRDGQGDHEAAAAVGRRGVSNERQIRVGAAGPPQAAADASSLVLPAAADRLTVADARMDCNSPVLPALAAIQALELGGARRAPDRSSSGRRDPAAGPDRRAWACLLPAAGEARRGRDDASRNIGAAAAAELEELLVRRWAERGMSVGSAPARE